MLYVQLDTNWPENPKRLRAGLAASGLHAICLCLSKRNDTDGWIERTTLSIYGADDDLLDVLVAERLLDVEGDRYRPHGWLEQNLSSDAIKVAKAEKSRMANHARWHDGSFESCERCASKRRSSQVDPVGVPVDSSVSHREKAAAAGAGDRRVILEAAADIIAARAADRPSTRNPERTRAAVKAGVISDRYQDAYGWIVANPDGDADELAEFLEPAPVATVHPLDSVAAAQRAAAERTAREREGTVCPNCNDHGIVLNDEGLAVRCNHAALEETS